MCIIKVNNRWAGRLDRDQRDPQNCPGEGVMDYHGIARRNFLKSVVAGAAGTLCVLQESGSMSAEASPLIIREPFHGAVLNHRHGKQTADGLTIRVSGDGAIQRSRDRQRRALSPRWHPLRCGGSVAREGDGPDRGCRRARSPRAASSGTATASRGTASRSTTTASFCATLRRRATRRSSTAFT